MYVYMHMYIYIYIYIYIYMAKLPKTYADILLGPCLARTASSRNF